MGFAPLGAALLAGRGMVCFGARLAPAWLCGVPSGCVLRSKQAVTGLPRTAPARGGLQTPARNLSDLRLLLLQWLGLTRETSRSPQWKWGPTFRQLPGQVPAVSFLLCPFSLPFLCLFLLLSLSLFCLPVRNKPIFPFQLPSGPVRGPSQKGYGFSCPKKASLE